MAKSFPFWILTFTAILALVVSQLVQDGMFMDGMIYVTVSRNLADGLGTFWNPYFSETLMTSYHEQPPLYFGLLALFYKVFGTSMYVERLFSLVCLLVTSFYIHLFWKKLFLHSKQIAIHSWIPVLFYAITPVCFWAYTNHVEETVMVIFATMASYYLYCALFLNKQKTLFIILGGILIFLAGLTKGVQGMFPIATVGIYWLISEHFSWRKMLAYTLTLIAIPLGIFLILWSSNAEVSGSFISYYNDRYLPTFNNVMNTTGNRFDILLKVFLEILPIAIISSILLIVSRKLINEDQKPLLFKKSIVWLMMLGLSGTVPLMITLEQRGFYIVTAMPFFVLAISMVVAPRIATLIERVNSIKSFRIVSLLLFLCTIFFCYSQIGKYKRDENTLSDIQMLKTIIPENSMVGFPSQMSSEWSFQAYMMRYNKTSLKLDCNHCKYFLIYNNLDSNLVPSNYMKLNLQTRLIAIYRQK